MLPEWLWSPNVKILWEHHYRHPDGSFQSCTYNWRPRYSWRSLQNIQSLPWDAVQSLEYLFVTVALSLGWSHLKDGHGSPHFLNLTCTKHLAEGSFNLKRVGKGSRKWSLHLSQKRNWFCKQMTSFRNAWCRLKILRLRILSLLYPKNTKLRKRQERW